MSKEFWIVLAAGVVACLAFGGFGHVIYWVLACAAYHLFTKKPLLGVLSFAALAAIAFVPALLDDMIYEKQLANKRGIEVRTDPIDLRGKTVVFSDEAYHTKAGCRDLCEMIVKYGGAKQVLFGVDRSVVGYSSDRPLNFKERELYAYPDNPQGAFPITSEPMRVTPERIDYVVFRFAHSKPVMDQWRKDIGLYGMEKPSLFTDVIVVETEDGATAQAFDGKILLSLLKMNRSAATTPYFPFIGDGKQKFGHQYVGGDLRNAQLNEVEALDFLCGPASREGAQTCRRSLDR